MCGHRVYIQRERIVLVYVLPETLIPLDEPDEGMIKTLLFLVTQSCGKIPFYPVCQCHIHDFLLLKLVGIGMMVNEQKTFQPTAVCTYIVFF